jgi:cobalt-zinc-cadmium efflux system protein
MTSSDQNSDSNKQLEIVPTNQPFSASGHSEHDHEHDRKSGPGPHSHAHSHGDARMLSKQRLFTVLAITGSFMIIEAVGGWLTGSLSLVADAGHMLGDVAALALAVFAMWLSSKPANSSRTFGYHRSEILAALANSVMLVLISIFVFGEAISRFSNPPEVQSVPMLIVATAGLVVNLISMRLLTDGAEKSLNAKAAYLEVFSDMIASAGVIVASIIMITTKWYLADPLLSALLSIFILWRTWGLLKESIDILMENAPGHVNLSELTAAMAAVPGVVAVHDLHVWTITSGMIAMSGHVAIQENADPEPILDQLKDLLEHEYEINHTTIQLERENKSRKRNDTCTVL